MKRTLDCCEIACSLESRYKANDCWSWSCISTSPVRLAVSRFRPSKSAAGGPEGEANLRLLPDAHPAGQSLSVPARLTAASSSNVVAPSVASRAVCNGSRERRRYLRPGSPLSGYPLKPKSANWMFSVTGVTTF